jgi:uncharacterized membrane protein YjjP (DUF1212 family)
MLNYHADCNRQLNEWQHKMPEPNTVFAFVTATLIGALFHLIFGGRGRRLLLFIVMSWLGFGMGDAAGRSLGIALFKVGDLHFAFAISGCVFVLLLVHIFTSGRATRRRPNRRVRRP